MKSLFLLFFSLLTLNIYAQDKYDKDLNYTIAFYNVENLFDTVNNPGVNDVDFTPSSPKNWDYEKYQEKLNNLGLVLSRINENELPEIIGLCEIENKGVIDDLIKSKHLKKGKYQIVHKDSPDRRGIDVALIYRKKQFKPICEEWLAVDLPRSRTRDILYVYGELPNGDSLHIFVNHWPSRSGGEEKSRANRFAAAKVLREKVDEILIKSSQAKIVIMGDFNDYPVDSSIFEILGASGDTIPGISQLYNMMYDLHVNKGKGSYNYRGNWGALDQIIVSYPLLNASFGVSTTADAAVIFDQDFLMYFNKNNKPSPSRTYGGNNYYGGFSDHLPVYLKLQLNR